MPLDFKNELYSHGSAGFVDFVWLWYNRLSVIIVIAIFIIAVILALLSWIEKGAQEGFVGGTNFKNMNRDRMRPSRKLH